MTDDDAIDDAVQELLDRAEEMPYGPARVAVHEEAIALAGRANDDMLGFEARHAALWPCYHGKRPDLLMVHFAWCVACLDRHPDADADGLLFTYRWVIDSMPHFETIPRAAIDRTWDEMCARHEAAGYSLRPCWVLRRRLGCALGDRAMAADAHGRYKKFRRDEATDDPETEAAFDVFYHARWQDDAATFAAATPFRNGKFTDPEFLIGIHDTLLMPLVRAGRVAQARDLQRKSARMMASRPHLLGTADDQIEFLAVVEDFPAAIRTVERHFGPSLAHPGRLESFKALTGTKLLTARLLKAGRTRLTIKLPAGLVPGHGPRVPVAALDEWLTGEVAAVAKLADDRNGNTYFGDRVAELAAYHALADELQAAAKDSHD